MSDRSPAPPAASIALRCDAGRTIGVGHAVRCLALGEELRSRGHQVTLWGDLGGVAWLEQGLASAGVDRLDAPSAATDLAAAAGVFDAVVLDGYALDPASGAALRSAGVCVLAMVDGPFGAAQSADLYVDQNLGALPHVGGPPDSTALAGVDYALFRSSVLAHRRDTMNPGPARQPPRVVCVFGGTDPYDAAGVVVPSLLSTGRPCEVTVVAARPATRTALETLVLGAGQSLDVIDPSPDFAAVVATADLAISASGSSVWELLTMGVPTAVVCVVDNQEQGYRATLNHEVVAGLGTLSRYDAAAADTLAHLLDDESLRHMLARRGQELVDGHGRERVADALDAVLTRR
ncbi:PseG/SpsG family protein [Rudaeicoccus suwonensis]|uniref:Spore coat polysaccharide biosynthesis predicted glycosyltransferase SpsG n=1 Tax=Rudaeicoccus suwonensis TaxID=657409 RepID=A0A561E8Z9_9MICO|nr:spore coat protein [Rudaeicoccus suwonensis]TWE12105.1 spore coat polysaccharide biosynthesis predicted glycosyltransferase SpsG [Rudaeicoccus suwonensis]